MHERRIKALGFRIKELREKKRMSQEELAEKANVSRTTISQLENDATKTTTTSTLNKIADALGVKMESLFLR